MRVERLESDGGRLGALAIAALLLLPAAPSAEGRGVREASALRYCKQTIGHHGATIGLNTRVTSCRKAEQIVKRRLRGASIAPYTCRHVQNPIFAYSFRCKGPGGRRIYTYDRNAGE